MIRDAIEGAQGFIVCDRLSTNELAFLRDAISEAYIRRLHAFAPELVHEFERRPIERYHEVGGIDHRQAWPKGARLLSQPAARRIREMGFFQRLEHEFGDLRVSNEEGLAPEEITWRLVRPRRPEDVGPIHADKWFWDLGHGEVPSAHARFKVWIPIAATTGRNGLRVVAGSHLRNDWKYHGEMRDGLLKPVLDEDEATLGAEPLALETGDVLAFHDALLHGGAVNQSTICRISLEFTCLFRN